MLSTFLAKLAQTLLSTKEGPEGLLSTNQALWTVLSKFLAKLAKMAQKSKIGSKLVKKNFS